MNRRQFLTSAGVTATALAITPKLFATSEQKYSSAPISAVIEPPFQVCMICCGGDNHVSDLTTCFPSVLNSWNVNHEQCGNPAIYSYEKMNRRIYVCIDHYANSKDIYGTPYSFPQIGTEGARWECEWGYGIQSFRSSDSIVYIQNRLSMKRRDHATDSSEFHIESSAA